MIAIFFACSAILLISERRATATAITQEELRGYARDAANEYEIFIEQSRHLLSILSELPQVKEKDPEGCSALFRSILRVSNRYVNIGVVTKEGELWCSGLPIQRPINIADREYFQRTVESEQFTMGDYVVGRLSRSPVITMSVPVFDDGGEVRHVLSVGVQLSWLQTFAKRAELPSQSVVTVVDNQGLVLASYSHNTASLRSEVGKRAPELDYRLDNIEHIERNLGEIEAADELGNEFYVIAVPLRREDQSGYLHLILSVPKDAVVP